MPASHDDVDDDDDLDVDDVVDGVDGDVDDLGDDDDTWPLRCPCLPPSNVKKRLPQPPALFAGLYLVILVRKTVIMIIMAKMTPPQRRSLAWPEISLAATILIFQKAAHVSSRISRRFSPWLLYWLLALHGRWRLQTH